MPDEPVAPRDLWPLLPETATVPLTDDALLPVLLLFPSGWPNVPSFSDAEVCWIPHRVKALYNTDHTRLKEHLDRYPALRDSELKLAHPAGELEWRQQGPGLTLGIAWRAAENGFPQLRLAQSRTLSELGVACYRSTDNCVVTPTLGTMTSGLHPFLALWAVLLALSSLARYEPAAWSKMIDIDRSAEANAIEHLLEEATTTVPAAALHLLSTFT